MADWLKIATRIAVCVALLAASVALVAKVTSIFTGLPVGELWALVGQAAALGIAMLTHYFGDSLALWIVNFTIAEITMFALVLVGTTVWQATRWLDHVWQ